MGFERNAPPLMAIRSKPDVVLQGCGKSSDLRYLGLWEFFQALLFATPRIICWADGVLHCSV